MNRSVIAFNKGYRVTADGKEVISHKGISRSLYTTKSGYKSFAIKHKGKPLTVKVHRLQGYQKFGQLLFGCDCLRHLNGNSLDNSWDNLELGTLSDNSMDMPKEVRVSKALHATSFVRKHDKEEIKKYHDKHKSYKKTMQHFGISSKGTLWFVLNK